MLVIVLLKALWCRKAADSVLLEGFTEALFAPCSCGKDHSSMLCYALPGELIGWASFTEPNRRV